MTSLAQWVPVAVRHHTVGRVGRPRSVSEGPGVLSLLLRPLERRGDSPRDGSRKSWRDTHALARHTARLVKWYGGIIHRCARLIGAAQTQAWPAMVVLTHPRRAATNLVLFAVSGLCPLTAVDAQAAWGEYRLGRLSSILVRERAAALASAHVPDTVMIVSGDRVGIRATVTYTGESRPIAGAHRELFQRWRTAMDLPASVDSLFTTECRFVEDSLQLWLPVQEAVRLHLYREVKNGTQVTIFASYVGAVRRGPIFDWLLMVNEYDRPSTR